MKKALLIAEKPSLLRNIMTAYKKYGNKLDYTIDGKAQVGHLFGLKMPNEIDEDMAGFSLATYPWYPNKWAMKITDSSKIKIFNEIRDAINSGNYDFIIHAGDPDQEGELLVRETLMMSKNKLPVKRMWVNGSTAEDFFHEGLNNLHDDNEPFYEQMYQSALVRQKSDYLIGMNLSSVTNIKTGQTQNVGRLKTFICGLVVKRQDEIDNFVPSSKWSIIANIKTENNDAFDVESKEQYETKEEVLAKMQKLSKEGKITKTETKETKIYAPSLFKLSTLQIAGSSVGLNAKRVSSALQTLYEHGYCSYPRTSCEYIASNVPLEQYLCGVEVFPELANLVPNVSDSDIARVKGMKKYVDDKKVASSGHVGLTPTGKKPDLSSLSSDEKKVYELICKRFLAIFLPPCVEKKTSVEAVIDNEVFTANGSIVLEKGYTVLLQGKKESIVPPVKENDIFKVLSCKEKEIEKKCPSPYNDGTLIRVLENPAKELNDKSLAEKGLDISIGQPSTRASTLEQLEKKGYLDRKGKSLVPTEKCSALIHDIGESFLVKADTTASMERYLENIRTGAEKMDVFLNLIWKQVQEEVARLKTLDMHSVKNYETKEKATGFSKMANKEVSFSKEWGGHTFTEKEIEDLLADKEIVITMKGKSGEYTVKGKLTLQTYKNRQFYGFQKICLVDENGADIVDDKVHGKWKNKEVSFKKTWGGHTFTEKEIEDLLADKEISFVAQGKKGEYTVNGKLKRQKIKGKNISYVGFCPDFM